MTQAVETGNGRVALTPASAGVRPPKTAELVARRLRRMIVDAELRDGDFLPHEAALMEHFNVSRPTLREAVRVLESEGLVELRRGSRTGAKVTIPGPEAVARPAALQLQLAGATLDDVWTARAAIEPFAARLLAQSRDADRYRALEEALEEERALTTDPQAFAVGSAMFHLRLVQLSGNHTLALMAGMLHDIVVRQTASAVQAREAAEPSVVRVQNRKAVRAYEKLLSLVTSGRADEAESFWRRHLEVAGPLILRGAAGKGVIDVLE